MAKKIILHELIQNSFAGYLLLELLDIYADLKRDLECYVIVGNVEND